MRYSKLKGFSDHQNMPAYLTQKPYGLLLFTAIALLVALNFIPIANLDLQDKTMFSVPLPVFVWIVPLILISFWLLYLPTKRFQYSSTLTWTHILITVFTTVLTVVILYIVLNPSSRIYFRSSEDGQQLLGNAALVVFVMFVCGQCTYIVNVLLGIFGKRQHSLKRD